MTASLEAVCWAMAERILSRFSFGAFERSSMFWIQGRRRRPLTSMFKFATYSGTGSAWISCAILLNVLENSRVKLIPRQTTFLRCMLCALAAWGMGSLLKKAFNRKRPFEQMGGCVALISTPPCKSFPSSHASSAIAFSVALMLSHHPWAMGVLVWACLVSYSRVYLGVHFPSDILGGAFLGVLCGFLIFPITALFHGLGI